MRILFWGTPQFAAPALRALTGEGFEVCGVVTQPDRPVGRDRRLTPPVVKTIALEEEIPVLQPQSARAPELLTRLGELCPDLSVVVAYGHILPRAVIELPARGTINIHASLLPALRGAAPIQAAIHQGMQQTGISIMRMVPALDAGPVILQAAVPIAPDETYGELQVRLAETGALALVEALALMELGKAAEQPQDESRATYAPKIDRDSTRVDWARDAASVCNSVRAFDPSPGAWTPFSGMDLKLFDAHTSPELALAPGLPGELLSAGEGGLVVACGAGAVRIGEVQPSGRRRMPAADWHRGRGIAVGDRLG